MFYFMSIIAHAIMMVFFVVWLGVAVVASARLWELGEFAEGARVMGRGWLNVLEHLVAFGGLFTHITIVSNRHYKSKAIDSC